MPHVKEQVFAGFSSQQAKEYQNSRGTYPARVYEEVVKYHSSATRLVVDVGCGPGNGTRDLLSYFDRVVGLDASAAMIEAAREMIALNMVDRLSFENLPAESIDKARDIAPGSVDVVTAATAAHWFDLPAFYRVAHRILRPGGTMALWVPGLPNVQPKQPHAEEIIRILGDLRLAMAPFRQKSAGSEAREKLGDGHETSLYRLLPLPWNGNPPVKGFVEASFQRIELCDANGNQAVPGASMRLSDAERKFGSGSPIIRWREQFPDLAGTDEDIVKSRFNKIRQLLGQDDPEIAVDLQFAILLWRKEEE